jgi:hypothetical protein
VICGGCDFILDASFLGDDITDQQAESRPGAGGIAYRDETEAIPAAPGPTNPSVEAGMSMPSEYGDALILGDLDDDLASFEGANTGLVESEATNARIYVGGATQAVLNPLAVPVMGAGKNQSLKFSPFERHVLEFVDGSKPVGKIQEDAGLDAKDFFTTMALLADKGFIRIRTGMSLADDPVEDEDPLFEDEDDPTETMVADGPPASLLLDDDADSVADEHGVFASSAEDSLTDNSPLDGPLAFADSLASQERDVVEEESTAARRKRARRKRRRPPPLPAGGAPAASEASAEGVVEMTTGDVFASASSVHDLPTDLGDEEADGSSDAFLEASELSEEDTADVQSLPTQPPSGPVSLDAMDISLASIEAPGPAEGGYIPPLPGGEDDMSWGPTEDIRSEQPPEETLEIDEDEPPPPQLVVQPAAAEPVRPTAPTAPAAKVSPADQLEVADEEDDAEEVPELSFEMRRKADKLFENAQKDKAAGRLSSAIMNAKLALHYNPHFKECIAALAEWEAAPAPRASNDRERILVEAAQDAEARGQYQQAIEMLDEALGLSPRVAAIHNLKGVILATRLKRYREASACLMRAVDLAPGNATYKNNLGKVVVKEELAGSREGGPVKRKKKKKKKGDESHIVIKKLRPKFF